MFTNDLPSQDGHITNRITIAFLTCFHACFDQNFGASLVVDAQRKGYISSREGS